MANLLAFMPAPRGPHYDVVMYLGVGELEVRTPDTPAVARLVLVEGDPEIAGALQRRWEGRGGVEVIEATVAATAGPLDWHRYSLPALNGPADHLSLTRIYPRLRRIDSSSVNARALHQLVDDLMPATRQDAGPNCALLVDLPGQDDALLASLGPEALRRFDVIVTRSAQPAAALDAAGFQLQQTDQDASPLWPIRTFVFDRTRHELQELRAALLDADTRRVALEAKQAEHAQVQDQLEALRRRSAPLQSELDEARIAMQQLRGELDQAHSESDALRQQLANSVPRAEMDRVRQLNAALSHQTEQLTLAQAQAQQQCQALQAQLDAARAECAAAEAEAWPQRYAALERTQLARKEEQVREQQRVQQLQEELLKAEGQLEMIKSLLLAGQGL